MANKLRYVVSVIDKSDDPLSLDKLTYKILDLDTDQLGFASYKSLERAHDIADKKNSQPKLIRKAVHYAKNNQPCSIPGKDGSVNVEADFSTQVETNASVST